MNSQTIRSFIVLVCVLCSSIFFCQNFVQATDNSSLTSLIRDYLRGETAEQSQEFLKIIIKHPDANLQTVEAIIRDIPQYSSAPVGAQPRRSITVRGKERFVCLVCASFVFSRASLSPHLVFAWGWVYG